MRDPHKKHIFFWMPYLKLRWGQICEGESLEQRLGGLLFNSKIHVVYSTDECGSGSALPTPTPPPCTW